MAARAPEPRSAARLLAVCALTTLIPVAVLGVALAFSFRHIVQSHGLVEGRSEATLVAQTAVEPQLDARLLSRGLSQRERDAMERLVHHSVSEHHVLRLRLRDLAGRVVFSDDGTGIGKAGHDDEALRAAHGQTVARLTHLNSDGIDDGPAGVSAVEVYLPLKSTRGAQRIGVLEVYLPYAPIAADVNAGLHTLYRDLVLGLAALYVVLFLITLSVSRGLRRELATNEFLAFHDALTGLPNRARFVERANDAVRGATADRPATLAILDLDHFKDINDTLGHSTGDELLKKLGARLRSQMRAEDTIARLGGDEFGIVLAGDPVAELALQELAKKVAGAVELRGLPLSVAPSIGYVTVTGPSETVEVLMQRADVAMYAAKSQHTAVVEYSPGLDHYHADDLELMSELPRAIDGDQLVVHYQPQTDIRSDTIVSAEALVRWQHPTLGLLPPGRFLPMAEQTDVIEQITKWVLARALGDAARLLGAGEMITISVNVSARSIVRKEFVTEVVAALTTAGVPPSRLVLEVTETALLTDPTRAKRVLSELSAAGVRVSIDDFGQGHTSLGYLANLPINELKIDRSFVAGMSSNTAQAAIVQSVIELGHNLSMSVVAEGIESSEELEALRELECDIAQGFHLARPMPFGSLSELLRDRRVASADARQPGDGTRNEPRVPSVPLEPRVAPAL